MASTGWATAQPRRAEWLDDLHDAGIPAQWSTDILTRLWRKLALNCAINPLTVLHDCRTAACSATWRSRSAVRRTGQPAAALRPAGGRQRPAEEVQRVILATAANYSSMYQDVRHGRRTEIITCWATPAAPPPGMGNLPQLEHLQQRLVDSLKAADCPATDSPPPDMDTPDS
jgi:2-dehydropantoate 2-reductase